MNCCRSVFNSLDLLILVVDVANVVLDFRWFFGNHERTSFGRLYVYVADIFELLRITRFLKLLKFTFPMIMSYFKITKDAQMAFSYELAKTYAVCAQEILDMLPHMVDNKKIRTSLKRDIENDKFFVTKLLSLVQKERPWVAITVKTKQAIRIILNSMVEAVNTLKTSGLKTHSV